MKKLHLALSVILAAQLATAAIIFVERKRTENRATVMAESVAPAKAAVPEDATAVQIARARIFVEELRSGTLDPFAGNKYESTERLRQNIPRQGRLSAYDRMVATTEGGTLVRDEIAGKVDQTYSRELAALKLTADEHRKVSAILTDLEMTKVDIKSMSVANIPYAELDSLYQAAAGPDLKRLEETLGAERYRLATKIYSMGAAYEASQAFINECSALGIPLNDAAKNELISVWQESTAPPSGLVIGSVSRSNVKTDWERIAARSVLFLNQEQQVRLHKLKEKAGQRQ